MHIANVIVNSRAFLADAEKNYGRGYKGTASECLASMGAFLREELPGITTKPVMADPETDIETSKEAEKTASEMVVVKPVEPEQTSQ